MPRLLLLVAFILLVPIVPFVLLHGPIEDWVSGGSNRSPPGPWTVGSTGHRPAGDGCVPADPVKLSKHISRGSVANLGRYARFVDRIESGRGGRFRGPAGPGGRPLAERLAGDADLRRMERATGQYATSALVLTRALPSIGRSDRPVDGRSTTFIPTFLATRAVEQPGNRDCVFRAWTVSPHNTNWLPVALSISIALPLLATWIVRRSTRNVERRFLTVQSLLNELDRVVDRLDGQSRFLVHVDVEFLFERQQPTRCFPSSSLPGLPQKGPRPQLGRNPP